MNDTSPLRGVRVLDLTRLLPGPVCSLHLADLGADVIKIEDTGAGDYVPPILRAIINRNKRGIRIDLKQQRGLEAFLRLARSADIVIEGFRPGVADRLGISYDVLSKLNPKLVYCSISGYGQTGPYRDAPGHDLNYCGFTGVADQIGFDAQSPALSNVPLADLMGGTLTALMGIQAALFDAQRSGRGRYVDMSISDGVLAHAVMPLATLGTHGHTYPAGGDTLSGGLPCYGLYRTRDGRFMAVGALERKFWDRFCELIERPDLTDKHRSRDAAVNRAVHAELTALFASQDQEHWAERFRDNDCCVTPVLKLEEALQHEQFRARDMVLETEHPTYGPVTQAACPVRMSQFQFSLRRHAPLPGEHTREILKETGLSDADINELSSTRAVV
ncbi:CoA-transferase [Alcanivorax sp. S71-1-4]|uniref:CaiB/BaiF CoA transferase family protein n=1 Tax=Alcanivorax sp. S71-1-4 TaxID=1177159 RepID=UPI0013598D60|nr:CaiB/BaiF CoA-transferase family protein [Alcanivorax sp. S71-1-4]KAF0810178.1 CoA-transferase [Alcanivorax sp. S71-1-4]